ncbi:MAG: ABC transporter ATP-binding protein [Armatimonadetes bacterium]|nr:ABC transporter ATP-binding protein [Armatimonadota bacterium]
MREQRTTPAQRPFGFGPGGPMHGVTFQQAKDRRGTVRRLWPYLRSSARELIIVSGLVVITTLLGVLAPYLLGRAIDHCLRQRHIGDLAHIVGLLAMIHIINPVGMYLQSVLMVTVSQRAVRDLRRHLFERLQRLSVSFFDTHAHGDVMSRLTNDVDTVNNALSQGVVQLVGSLLGLTATLVMIFWLHWRLALVTMTMVPLIYAVTGLLGKMTRVAFRARQKDLGALNGLIEETLTGQRVVKAFRREERILADFDEANERLKKAAIRAGIIGGSMGPCMNLTRNLSYAIMVGAGCWMVGRGLATIGLVAAFLEYSGQFMRPLMQIAQVYGMVQGALAGAERVFATMDEAPEPPDEPDAVPLPAVRGEVTFDNVDFAYEPETLVLREVSFHAHAGQTIGLVGPTGAGKTTIINLLTRFYDVANGAIRIDGHDLRGVRRADLRHALAIVPQDPFLFGDTVRENIRYGRLEATDDEVVEAARVANADAFIRHLPEGYDTVLTESGSGLSRGQRQLVAIARAILADPAILILDEATSSVDTRTEAHIQEAMLRVMEGRTSFLIAHRLSTVRHADVILVLDGGRVVESGSHDDLVSAGGLYARLHHSFVTAGA